MKTVLSLLFALFILTACGNNTQPLTSGEWRVVMTLPGGEMPVDLELDIENGMAWFRNGRERLEVPNFSYDGENLELDFPVFNNHLKIGADSLEGTLTLVKRGYEQEIPVTMQPGDGYRFIENPIPEVDLTGRWEIEFVDDEGNTSAAVGEFDQQDGDIYGTFLTPLGDYRYLYGNVHGRELRLSTFDGAHAFLFSAVVNEAGQLEGDFWSGTKWHESWTGDRNFDAALPDANSLTFLKEGYDRVDFSFPDLNGQAISLSDDKYQGKVVLVTLAGTWCPNCADEAAFLAPYYKTNKDRGLEVVTLLYEHFEDFETAAAQGHAFKDKHGIEFDVVVAGISDKTQAAETLPMLNKVLAFPTMIFIDRNGDVRRIHTGFSGPGTGSHYQKFQGEFITFMDGLLAEQVRDDL